MTVHVPAGYGMPTILVVDDDDIVREVLREMLSRLGYTVLTAADGAGAVAALGAHSEQIGLIVFDRSMPDVSGEHLFKWLRQAAPEAKTLLTSGYSELELLEDMRNGGLTGFLAKPFTYDQVKAAVSRALSQATAAVNGDPP